MFQSISRVVRGVRALSAYVTLARDPNKLGQVFELREALADPEVVEMMRASLARDPKGAEAMRTKPRVGTLDLQALAALPEHTLGGAFGRHMIGAGLDPSAIPTLPADTDGDYLQAHLYETHDIWHVVTGFHTDVAGELGLQAFYLAQFPAPLAVAILSGGLLNTVIDKRAFEDRDRRMDEIARGWAMGRAAKPFFGMRWAEMWERPLEDVRRELSVIVSDSVQPRARIAAEASPSMQVAA